MKKGKRKGFINAVRHYTIHDSRYWAIWGEDGRKVGLALMLAGVVGIFSENFSLIYALALSVVGMLCWNICSILYCMAKHSREDKEQSHVH